MTDRQTHGSFQVVAILRESSKNPSKAPCSAAQRDRPGSLSVSTCYFSKAEKKKVSRLTACSQQSHRFTDIRKTTFPRTACSAEGFGDREKRSMSPKHF